MDRELKVTRQEYPRPSLVRQLWQNLNGEWQYEEDNSLVGEERRFYEREEFEKKIIVPFAPESELSGIGNTDFITGVWYKKKFRITREGRNHRVILHFGAVDYDTKVWVNGTLVGRHIGGFTPFSFDITNLVRTDVKNDLIVFAKDDTRNPLQPTGKQAVKYENSGCHYTRTTGIWQTVWIEYVPDTYITSLKLTPDVDNEKLHISATLNKSYSGDIHAFASLKGEGAAATSARVNGTHVEFSMTVRDPQLWYPDDPVLYDLEICVGQDCITSYFGMRKVSIKGYAIAINDIPIYQRLILDQGFFPDGIYTAPTDEALRDDILLSKKMGFNGARMHQKVFEPRYIYWADKLGYLLWGEYPSWGLDVASPSAMNYMLPEWLEAVQRDYNSPAIIGWCPFNETRENASEHLYYAVIQATKAYDPTRIIIDSSGYSHGPLTEIYDVHNYEQDVEKFAAAFEEFKYSDDAVWQNHRDMLKGAKYLGQPYMVSEFGGALWAPQDGDARWGYGNAPQTEDEFYERYEGLVNVLLDHPKMCGFCYTQLTDVFQEKNGLLYFDRSEKFDAYRIKSINSRKAAVEE